MVGGEAGRIAGPAFAIIAAIVRKSQSLLAILNAPASVVAASVYLNIGITGRTRSTRANLGKRMGLNCSKSADQCEREMKIGQKDCPCGSLPCQDRQLRLIIHFGASTRHRLITTAAIKAADLA